MKPEMILPPLAGMLLAPLALGIVNRTKAVFAGRRGAPLLQTYFDLAKLLRKGAVYSRTTTWLFRAAPAIGLACMLVALAIVPMGKIPALLAFPGDIFLLAYTLGMSRFATVLAALDTGSAFEGMGASREVQFSAVAEIGFIAGLVTLALVVGRFSLTEMLGGLSFASWGAWGPFLALVAAALFFVFLAENCRIPVDDPNTHLELTMIHEVMILDHSGVDLAFILYGASLKFWVLGSILVQIPASAVDGSPWVRAGAALAGMFLLSVAVGVVESVMARLRLVRVPRMLWIAAALAILSFTLVGRYRL